MALILMFDKMQSREDEIRFSLFKFKVPRHPRPAWDFQHVINRVEAGRQYGFRRRLVWKKFKSAEDCRREYQTWSADHKQCPRTHASGKKGMRRRSIAIGASRLTG